MERRTFLGSVALAAAGGRLAIAEGGVARAAEKPASDVIEEIPRSTPVVQSCDVCVLGGSCTGVFAAVRAAQMGAKVAIVEKQNAFGGVAASGLVNIWHKLYSNVASDANQLTAAEIEGRRQIRAYMDIARKYGDKDNKPCLLDLASHIGIRETRPFNANYRLTEKDVMSCKRFPDAIANGTYPIDVHDPKTGKFKFKRPEGDFYQIPLSTMVSDKAPNIVLAGRMISTDRGAFGGIRVMVNLNQVGEAAGVTASLAVSGAKSVSDIDAGAVRDQLSNLGAVVV